MSARNELPDEVKTFVVQALACFDTPSEVVRAVKEEFDIAVSRQAVQAYDPTKHAGAFLSAEFRSIFDTTRAAFLTEKAVVSLSHRAVRLRRLQRYADLADARGNTVGAAKFMEQMAREMGGAFTNKRELAGDPDGAPLVVKVIKFSDA